MNRQILSIERIQNRFQWARFQQEAEQLKVKNGQPSKEMDLWHGTRQNPPELIYEGQEGFDMRFVANG